MSWNIESSNHPLRIDLPLIIRSDSHMLSLKKSFALINIGARDDANTTGHPFAIGLSELDTDEHSWMIWKPSGKLNQ